MEQIRALILCTGNSARSQMGEGLLKHLTNNTWEVVSAGVQPSSLNPFAVLAMAEIGIDIRDQFSKSVSRFVNEKFDYVITVCNHAAETCPIFPGNALKVHFDIPDPAVFEGTYQEKLDYFILIRDLLKSRFQIWLDEINTANS